MKNIITQIFFVEMNMRKHFLMITIFFLLVTVDLYAVDISVGGSLGFAVEQEYGTVSSTAHYSASSADTIYSAYPRIEARPEKLSEKYTDFDKMDTCSRLAIVYEKRGEYKTALEFKKKETVYFDKIDRDNILNQYDQLYKKFFKAIQDKQLKNLFETNVSLKKAAYVDELTKAHSRLYYEDFAERLGKKGTYSAIMMDLDYFKEYNDNYGHLKGDMCLTAVAKISFTFTKREILWIMN